MAWGVALTMRRMESPALALHGVRRRLWYFFRKEAAAPRRPPPPVQGSRLTSRSGSWRGA